MATGLRRLAGTAMLAAAVLMTVTGCDPGQPQVLLSRTSPAPTPSTARVLPTASPTSQPMARPIASATAAPPTPTPSATTAPSKSPTASPTAPTTVAVTPVLVLPTATATPAPAATAAPTIAPAPTATPLRTHIVSYGETLAIIARRYGTTATAIARLNGLANVNRIYPGQRLTIP